MEDTSATLAPPASCPLLPGIAAHPPEGSKDRLLVGILLVISVTAVLAGQTSLELFSMDDLRETEVAREMLETGDYVVPHLAGRPFVEKPPLFQIVLSLAFRLAGGPGGVPGRLVSAAFALLSLWATYLLGRKMEGPLSGALSTTLLASAMLFCRVAHSVLLDNALTAALAWALVFACHAMFAEEPQAKYRWYAASFFMVGISFLFKGFVGPVLAAAGYLAAIGALGRWKELGYALHPAILSVLLLPMLAWMVPFGERASGDLLYEFFVLNHLGRAMTGYESHSRPVFHYLSTLWIRFAPASVLLPFAVGATWKDRHKPEGQGVLFLLFWSLGGLVFLSLMKAKDDVYVLPLYPALATLVGVWMIRWLRKEGGRLPVGLLLTGTTLAVAGVIAASVAVAAGRITMAMAGGAAALLLGAALGVRAICRGDRLTGGITAVGLSGIAVILCCLSPLSDWYVRQRNPKPALQAIARSSQDRDLFLYQPDDRLRGGCGYYRGRTALEIRDPRTLVERLRSDPRSLAVVMVGLAQHPELSAEAQRLGLAIEEKERIPAAGLTEPVALIGLASGARP